MSSAKAYFGLFVDELGEWPAFMRRLKLSAYRRTHPRINRRGTVHTVRGHYVNRGTLSLPLFDRVRVGGNTQRATPTEGVGWVRPNARCPVCNARVFYFQNRGGSRVFFDRLGPPWPKHPCTDAAQLTGGRLAAPPRSAAPRRGLQQDLFSPREGLGAANIVRPASRQAPVTGDGWDAYSVWKLVAREGRHFYVARPLSSWIARAVRFSTPAGPIHPRPGDAVYLKDDRLSFLDSETLVPNEISVSLKATKAASRRRRRKRRQKVVVVEGADPKGSAPR